MLVTWMDHNLTLWFKDDRIVLREEILAHFDHNGKNDDDKCSWHLGNYMSEIVPFSPMTLASAGMLCYAKSRIWGRYILWGAGKGVGWEAAEHTLSSQEQFECFVLFRANDIIVSVESVHSQLSRLTFFNKPINRTGNIFKISQIANCALAPAPAALILDSYVVRNSTILLKMASRASSSVCVSDHSTALFASFVAIATWYAEPCNDWFVVVGRAIVTTRIRRSPVHVLWTISLWTTTKSWARASSIPISTH